MKNTKQILKKTGKLWMWFCTTTVSVFIVFILIYNIALWVALNFNTHFFDIDSCLDLGGAWHYGVDQCGTTQEEIDQLIEQHGPLKPE